MRQLQDVQVEGMALVRRPANKKRFLTKKSEEAGMAENLASQVGAPDESVTDAIDAIRLAKGESVDGHEALHAAAHLLAGRNDLSHEDAMAFVEALSLQKAAKKDEKEEEAESDEEDEEKQEPEEDSDEGDDSKDEMPEFLKRKLKKGDFDESKHPRDDHGRFGEGGGGGDSKQASGSASKRADSASNRAFKSDSPQDHKAAIAAHEKVLASKTASRDDKSASRHAINQHQDDLKRIRNGNDPFRKSESSPTADSSANQGGPMEAEANETREFVSKSEHEQLLERLTKSELELADIRGREELRVEKSANEEAYSHLEVDHDALADVTLSLRKASDKKLDALASILKAANEQVRVAKASGGSPFRPQSIRGGVAKSQAAGISQFQQMVSEHQKANPGVSAAQAVTAVAKSAEGLAAYRASKGEN